MKCHLSLVLFLSLINFFCPFMIAAESPFAETAVDFAKWVPQSVPDDALSRAARQNNGVAAWVTSVLGNKKLAPTTIRVDVERLDHGTFGLRRSNIGTPLVVGSKRYERGLGVHSVSVLRFALPVEAKKFEAEIGIDNNWDTQGKLGTVTFAVEVGGKELYRSGVCKGGEEPINVSLELPAGTKELVLKVGDGGDGPSHDQADWANARITTATGEVLYLDDVKSPFFSDKIPFSFQYGGEHSSKLLPQWTFSEKSRKLLDRTQSEYRWLDPKTGLAVTAIVETFDQYPAVDWVLHFENTGDKETPLLENVAVIDTKLSTTAGRTPVRIHTLTGDTCDKYAWLTAHHDLATNGVKTFKPHGGRSSNGAFPFWNLQDGTDDSHSHGLFVALGWSGQWNAAFQRDQAGHTTVSAGMEVISTVLNPKEKIRSPRVLLMQWDGERQLSHVLFRRLLMYHYAPKQPDGRPIQMPIAGQCFDRYYRKRPGWETITGQLDFAEKIHRAGCNTYWFDAAWFPVGFPNGVGNWFTSDPKTFPEGLKPLGDFVHARNMKFLLWFEPERVAKGSRLAEDYPQFVFGGKNGGLYKLSDPEAQTFLTRLIGDRIAEYGVDIVRIDFNIDPLGFWRANDTSNRKGITEIRYVEGHYAMWDALLERFPGLWFDNCASGGRRIDLETIKRSAPLWRSDTCCWNGQENLDQNQQVGLMHYLPLFTGSAWSSDPYMTRSSASMGLVAQYNFQDENYQEKRTQQAIRETLVNQKIWYGDFYPMTETDPELGGWTAYQVHRSDLNAGIAVFFRRDASAFSAFQATLRNIDPEAIYQVELRPDYDNVKTVSMKGTELKNYEVKLPEKRLSFMLRYWKN